MSNEHYFSENAGADFAARSISVTLAGRILQVQTAAGIFSPEHVDQGTAILLQGIEDTSAQGNLLDIGCGWGPIALALAIHSPEAKVFAIDVNERSLELTRRNTTAAGLENVLTYRPEQVPSEIEFDQIWSNPPIRVGKDELHSIMRTWLPRLRVGGTARLVVQKHLGSDSLLRWLQEEFAATHTAERIDSQKTFRIIEVTRTL
jgi:16S rRNA G1207 methylase RsmC